ncbi:hypothetical protein LCGC14_2030960 [marine sediment metagenome]|uniref:Uncharacterized protein n=1 Tax=marine sediment metagenome TaxID=412755 RepID=A0A0F9EUY2_9ZZZZ
MKICSKHRDYEVPLIYTYAWNYYEYWCPYCDKHEGMLGAGEDVEDTKELKEKKKIYEKATAEYRGARGTLICASTKWKGKWIKPSELPKEEIERLHKLCKTWKLNVKIEVLK